jgi:hypothetical protein
MAAQDLRTVEDVAGSLPMEQVGYLPAPLYTGKRGDSCVALAVSSMRRHTTDEGWQIMAGLEAAGYRLCGHGLSCGTDVSRILEATRPDVVLMQDKREWDVPPGNFRDPNARFHGVRALQQRSDIFKLTILKDAHARPWYHAESAEEIGCHAWVTYYATPIVCRSAQYVRPEHIVRTYHTLDPGIVPSFADRLGSTLLSGAVSKAYPLRETIRSWDVCDVLPHPGYDRDRCRTPEYLRRLAHYRIAVCTSSMYGYALRKLMEATACGCIVVTDLPTDEVLPGIDENLVRIPTNIGKSDFLELLRSLFHGYDPARQQHLSEIAVKTYDYRTVCRRLADDIERTRSAWTK